MQDFGTKANDTAGPSGQLSADEFNNLATELENGVTRSGQGLTGASVTQIAQSLFLHGVKSESFQDSGGANAYVATPVSGAGGVLLPSNYTPMNGAVIGFKASASNSGASTLNIGQTTGTLLGNKAIVDQAGAALASGSIVAGRFIQLQYDSSIGAGSWVLMPWSVGGGLIGVRVFSVGGTYTPTPGTNSVVVDLVGGGGGGGGVPATGVGSLSVGGGGGGGSRATARFTTGFAGATVTVGAAGAAGGIGSTGGTGGSTAFGVSLSAPGGLGGSSGTGSSATPYGSIGGTGGGLPTLGNILNMGGQPGDHGFALQAGSFISGGGANSCFGGGGGLGVATATSAGNAARGPGAGGGGAANGASSAGQIGGPGGAGQVIIYEYT